MLKYRVMVFGSIREGYSRQRFDSYEEAKEYGDFIVGCSTSLSNKPEVEGYTLDPDKRPIPYLIVVDNEEDEDDGQEGLKSA